MFESLESRRLLSASLSEGVLTIVGTDSGDQIMLSVPKGSRDLVVSLNGNELRFKLSSIAQLEIFGLAGDDMISLDKSVKIGAFIDGGAGRDVMSGGSGNDTFYAVDGAADMIAGGGGRDTAYVESWDSANVENVVVVDGGGSGPPPASPFF